MTYDYIIIGSGFGGSVSAHRLTQKGYRVLVLEKGKRFTKADFPKDNRDLKRWMWKPSLGLHGIFQMSFFDHVTVMHGVGVGGGSLTYANTLPTPQDAFFTSSSWSHLADWKAELTPHYATAKRMLGATPYPGVTHPDKVMLEIAQDLGREAHYGPTEVAVFFGEPGKKVPDPFFDGDVTPLIWSLFWTALLYFDYSWFREQTCLIICPYGRLQSTLVDYDTIIIGYDKTRGEPRHKGKDKGGDCIDCRRCIDVCPTGIDIRNGLQMECIGCTACIDACDDIMRKIDKPEGLIRFDSSRGFETGKPARLLRPRFIIYAVMILILAGLFVMRATRRENFQVTVMRSQGLPYQIDGDMIRNLYTMHLQNKTDGTKVYFLRPSDDALAGYEGVEYIIPQERVELPGFGDRQLTAFAMMPKKAYTLPEDFHFAFTDSATGITQNIKVRFRGP